MEKQNFWLVFALLDSLKMDAYYPVYLELNFMLYFVSVMLDQNLVSLLLWLISFSSMNVYVNKTQRMWLCMKNILPEGVVVDSHLI